MTDEKKLHKHSLQKIDGSNFFLLAEQEAKSAPDQFNKDSLSCNFLIKCFYKRNNIESV